MSKTAWTTSLMSGHIRRSGKPSSKRDYDTSNDDKAATRRHDVGTGTGLIPESAPMVEDIADFWCQYHLGKPLREWLGTPSLPGLFMRNASPDTAQVLVFPPLVSGAPFLIGLLLHVVFPRHSVLPTL